jgi:hypothetical protein
MSTAADIKLTLMQAVRAWFWYVWQIRPKIVWTDKFHRNLRWNMAKWREQMRAEK